MKEPSQLIKKIFPWLFILIWITTAIDGLITSTMSEFLLREGTPMLAILSLGTLALCFSVMAPVISFLLFIYFLKKMNSKEALTFSSFSKYYFKPMTIESLRCLGQVFLWAFLFVIPGLVRAVQLFFVPFIIVFRPDYNEGKIDALKFSTQLANKVFLKLLFLFLIFNVLAPFLFDGLLAESKDLYTNTLTATLLVAIEAIIQIYGLWLMFSLYKSAEIKYES